ncbi:molybdate ABC transporter substrate-binding protein [[Limnothrix rosea] IAM M-220]|uniref:molybdate ABC transporter substrate-binding protein n=1 Tax=[Limnothrix rosea] IAM M-220 TaxID=454133 RepID=UPI0009686CB9|nr:molybdate ABC transporter substrate-binding protein [[Limnothrix rosea] IAM M-220]OKH19565.1 molybdate ABC transporter substrate-binding protein [[Limnothrix rosea] IAM M-220]
MVRFSSFKYFVLIILFLFFALCIYGCNFNRFRLHDQRVVVVAIASSLGDVMAEIKTEFLAKYPEVNLVFNVASSGVLAQQIRQNAPVDIFASADLSLIQRLIDEKKISSKDNKIFAHNRLVLAASTQSEIKLSSLDSLVKTDIQKIALGNPNSVPAGRYAKNALGRSPSMPNLYESLQKQQKLVFGENVRQVLAYLENQVADVGFIYQTDLRPTSKARSLLILDPKLTGEISYGIAPIQQGLKKVGTQNFIDFVLSPQGQQIIKEYGFLALRD